MISPVAVPAAQPNPAAPAATMLTVGIDVGGTKTSCVVTDADDRLLMHEVEPTNAAHLAEQVAALARRAVGQFAANAGGAIAAVGVAVPGRVETDSGRIALAVNLGGRDLNLGRDLESTLGLPCFIEHDARAAAIWVNAQDSTTADLAYLAIGTGISTGIVLNGRVLRGANGLAGEVGHVSAEPAGGACACGLHGCLEVVAAGPHIARMAREALATGRATMLPVEPTAADVFHAAAAGDALAQELVQGVAKSLARAIRALVLTLGVNHIVIGGGVAAAGEALLGPVLAAIDAERAASPLVDAAFREATVELLSPNAEAGARGAAQIARERVSIQQQKGVDIR